MTIRTRKQAIAVASRQTHNVPGTCQANVRGWFNAPSAGDQDKDGDSDAVDGWLSEPAWARHPGDRNPPNGYPLAFKGGSHGFGHRAMSGAKSVFSTDMFNNRYKAGVTSRVTGTSTSDAIAKIERSMGVEYVGWSKTIDGQRIPDDPTPAPKPAPVVSIPSLASMAVAPKRVPAWMNRFVHLDPNKYMNYHHAVLHLAPGERIDIDGQKSSTGTGWALHWGTVGKNHLHDPKGLIKPTRRIDSLTNQEIKRLRGPDGEQPFGLVHLLREVHARGASAEVELKVVFDVKEIKRWLANADVKALNQAGHLQFKTLASMAGAPARLAPAHHAGGTTILSFTKYTGAGVYKSKAWPVTNYYRGTAKWR